MISYSTTPEDRKQVFFELFTSCGFSATQISVAAPPRKRYFSLSFVATPKKTPLVDDKKGFLGGRVKE